MAGRLRLIARTRFNADDRRASRQTISIARSTGKTVDIGTRAVTPEIEWTRLHPKMATAAVMTATSIALLAATVTATIVATGTGGGTEADLQQGPMVSVT